MRRDIINRPTKTIYCSAACRTAACRKRAAPPAVREVQRLQAEVQQLRSWVKRLHGDNSAPRAPSFAVCLNWPERPKLKANSR
jgi:hypothetical protein